MKEIIEFLSKNKFGSLATCDGNKPDIRPFEVADISNEGMLFYASKDSDVMKQIYSNPYICFCATNENYDYVKVCGKVSYTNNDEYRKKILETSHFANTVYDKVSIDKMEVFCLEHGDCLKHTYVDGSVHAVKF